MFIHCCQRAASSSKLARVRGQGHFLSGGGGGTGDMDNAHVPTSVSRGRNERGASDRPRSARFRHLLPQNAKRACARFRHQIYLHHESITRTERDENLPLATAAVDHSRTRWRGADVSTREKSNVTSGAEGATTARPRLSDRGMAGDKKKAFPPSSSLRLSIPDFLPSFPLPPSPFPLLLSAHCRCHLCQKGAREGERNQNADCRGRPRRQPTK